MKNIFFTITILILFLFLASCSLPSRPYTSSRSRNPEKWQTPKEIVEEFYELYFQCLEDTEVSMLDSCLEVQSKRPYLTGDFHNYILEVLDNLGEPDYDPLLCARNVPNQGYKIGETVLENNQAQVIAIFLYSGKEHKVPIRLRKEGGVWKIEEIECNPQISN